MDDRKLRLGVGVLVVASIGIAVGLTMFFGAFNNLLTKHYTITYNFPSAPGVGYDTPVKKNGVQIGRVTNLQLLPDREEDRDRKPGGVDLTMEIDQAYPLVARELPRIATGSLITGDAVVEFVTASDAELMFLDGQAGMAPNGLLEPDERILASKPLMDKDYLRHGMVKGDPFQMVMNLENDFRQTLVAVQEAGKSIDDLAKDLQRVIGGDDLQLRAISQKTLQTMEEFRATIQDVRQIVSDPVLRKSLQDSLERFPMVLDETQRTFQEASRAIESFGRVAEDAERIAENVVKFTAPLGERSTELVDSLASSLKNFDRALVQVASFTEKLNSGNGTLKRLINDDELYWQVRNVMNTIEGTVVKIQPIVDDVRIFTDKVSRDPSQIGVRGALSGRNMGLGIK